MKPHAARWTCFEKIIVFGSQEDVPEPDSVPCPYLYSTNTRTRIRDSIIISKLTIYLLSRTCTKNNKAIPELSDNVMSGDIERKK